MKIKDCFAFYTQKEISTNISSSPVESVDLLFVQNLFLKILNLTYSYFVIVIEVAFHTGCLFQFDIIWHCHGKIGVINYGVRHKERHGHNGGQLVQVANKNENQSNRSTQQSGIARFFITTTLVKEDYKETINDKTRYFRTLKTTVWKRFMEDDERSF